jgi:PAS domain S-box-containing protein
LADQEITFDRSRLSARENDIFDLATQGLTDQQIALRLDISASTVNSYWVRIRGKLGHLSRTELVATALRQEAQVMQERLESEKAALTSQISEKSRHPLGESLSTTILDCLPEAVVAFDESGRILYANAQLENDFGYGPGELTDHDTGCLTLHLGALGCVSLDKWMDDQPTWRGVHELYYGKDKQGRTFRIMLRVSSQSGPEGRIFVALVRKYMEEVEARRQRAIERAVVYRSSRELSYAQASVALG